MTNSTARSNRGFSLIELMIAVAILGILVAIAVPSYTEHVRSSNRADARAALVELAQLMERYYTENNRYDDGSNGTTAPALTPSLGNDGYNISISNVTATSFTLQAAPVAGGIQDGDRCGTLTLDQTGLGNITGQGAGVTRADCW
ncbi:type IV pilin protein [Alkalilimnicola sp. S0819]|uniref:type IV pilin protein n=1 Tax=Alkalilimnicola sp. S0819 TaxID=2613922 RepID=UPI0012620DCC|nr:type IV pilin protein [Alkalilimnicola sp. S0819]KAB7623150.1 type IV pilin protein [Alkalilimnicola sp. S0819]MPQ16994.1 prepilin-type N-terminal cleavage/methylation domain-containing protein [Alkalilimnicola sp. S0819]